MRWYPYYRKGSAVQNLTKSGTLRKSYGNGRTSPGVSLDKRCPTYPTVCLFFFPPVQPLALPCKQSSLRFRVLSRRQILGTSRCRLGMIGTDLFILRKVRWSNPSTTVHKRAILKLAKTDRYIRCKGWLADTLCFLSRMHRSSSMVKLSGCWWCITSRLLLILTSRVRFQHWLKKIQSSNDERKPVHPCQLLNSNLSILRTRTHAHF